MFFESLNEIPVIAKTVNTSIFVVPEPEKLDLTQLESPENRLKNVFILQPVDKSVITIEQVRELISRLNLKQSSDQFVLIRPAEKMNPEAANAFLKNLEEPAEKVHFILATKSPAALLPTILSRSSLFILRDKTDRLREINADEKIKAVAKSLMTARPADLPRLAEEIAKKKPSPRLYALEVVEVTIEMLYKSYFLTGKSIFLKKLPRFLTLYENLQKNGHIKLQIIATLC